MALNDRFQKTFDNFEETINLNKTFTDGDNLYEICKIASIKLSVPINLQQKLIITSHCEPNGRIYFGVNDCLRILEHVERPNLVAIREFDDCLNGIVAIDNFLLICTQNGNVTIHTLNDDGTLQEIFKENVGIATENKFFVGCFQYAKTFYVVTHKGLVKKYILINDRFMSEIVVDLKQDINISALAWPFLCLEGDKELITLNLSNGQFDVDDAIGIENLHGVGNKNFFAYSKTIENIYTIDSSRCLIFGLKDKYPHFPFNDYESFNILGNAGDKQYIIALTKGRTKIQCLNTFSDLKIIYNILLPKGNVHLLKVESSTEEVIFIRETVREGVLEEIQLEYVTTTDPELRVRKLVEKGLIDKAEIFAEKFNVSKEIVAKAKATNIASKRKCTSRDIQNLLKIFESIKDFEFKMDCCRQVVCDSAEDTRRVISYAASMAIDVRDSSRNSDNALLKMKQEFNGTLRRFDTYMQAYKEFDQEKWKIFCQCNLVEEVKGFLRQDCMEEATVLLLSDKDIFLLLAENDVQEIMTILNKCLKPIVTFLNAFIPLTLKFRPEFFVLFVDWIYKIVEQMEIKDTFPECALKFLKDISKLMAYVPAQNHLKQSRNKLFKLQEALTSIQLLIEEFSIQLSLEDSLKGRYGIVSILLKKDWQPAQLELLMRQFIYPFILECGEDPDKLLAKQIEDMFLLQRKGWLPALSIVLKFINNLDERLRIIMDIMNLTSKPWSSDIKQIALQTAESHSSSPVAFEIIELIKLEHVLVTLQEYNINSCMFIDWNHKEFIFKRILFLNGDNYTKSIEDIHQLCSQDELLKADYLILKELILNGQADTAFSLLDQLDNDFKLKLGKELLELISSMSERHFISLKNNNRGYCHRALNPLWNRLKNLCKNKEIEFEFKTARAVYWIYDKFGIRVKRNLFSKSQKEVVIDLLLQSLSESLMENDSFENLLINSKNIGHYLDEPADTILIKLMKRKDNLKIILNIAEHLLETSENSDLLAQCAAYLFTYHQEDNQEGNETFLDVISHETKPNVSQTSLDIIKLARKLCIKALTNFNGGTSLISILEVLRWIDCCYSFADRKEELSIQTQLHNIYMPRGCGSFFATSDAVRVMLNVYAASRDTLLHETYFKSENKVSTAELKENVEQFIWSASALLKQDHHVTALNIAKLVQQTALICPEMKSPVLEPLENFVLNTIIPETIEALLAYKYVDRTLLFELMMFFDEDRCEKLISKYLHLYKRQPKKLYVVAQVGLSLLDSMRIKTGRSDLLTVFNLCKWWSRISDKNLVYESYFFSKPELRLEHLLTNNYLTIEQLPEYCADFGLDLQCCYLKYLKILLLNWQPDVDYHEGDDEKRIVGVKRSQIKLTDKCRQVIKHVTDQTKVFKLTEQIWPLVNFYYYEVFSTLIILHTETGGYTSTIPHIYEALLHFLTTYRRISRPTQAEIELWFCTKRPESLIDPLSEYRLPLSDIFLSNDILDIVKPEINLDTYKQWLLVAKILKPRLNDQDIYTYAIKNSFCFSKSATSSWEVCPKYEHLLPKIDACAKNIEDLEKATAAIYALMCEMPPGVDKVQMADLSLQYAKRCLRQNPEEEKNKNWYQKVEQRFMNYSAINILHKNQLAENKYLKQVTNSSQLIVELYSDPRIESYFDDWTSNCPDINKAVEELCSLFHLDSVNSRKQVLMEFLNKEPPLNFQRQLLQFSDENAYLKRACYLCKSNKEDYWRKYLFKHALNQSVDISVQVNALICLDYITDKEDIESLCGVPYEEFIVHLDKMCLIAKLRQLAIKCENANELDRSNHKRMLKSLAAIQKPLAVKCLAILCKIYGFDDIKYWEYIVNSAAQFNMYEEVKSYLEFLSGRCVYDYMKNAWHKVLSYTFDQFDWAKVSEADIYLLVQSCPVYELDMGPYMEKCLSNEREDLANVLKQVSKI